MTMNELVEIVPCVYLGSYNSVTENSLEQGNIKFIVNVTKHMPPREFPGVEELHIEIDDVPMTDFLELFNKTIDFMSNIVHNNDAVAVHCRAGVSRAPTLVIAYLMKEENMNLFEAFEMIKSKRRFIRPNIGFWKQLILYEKLLRKNNSVSIMKVGETEVPSVYEEETRQMVFV